MSELTDEEIERRVAAKFRRKEMRRKAREWESMLLQRDDALSTLKRVTHTLKHYIGTDEERIAAALRIITGGEEE